MRIVLCSADQPSCPVVEEVDGGGITIGNTNTPDVTVTLDADERARLTAYLTDGTIPQ
jgi:hypothetical protein